uniref:fibrillin-1-like n=1 Tax=Styela clava TaxID=7725 RepID=UPI00193A6B08|nr:fibrillin-1-like [Styela clava]
MIFLVVLFLVICQVGATLKIDAYEGYAYIANFSCNRDQELVTRTVQIGRVQSPCYDGTSINYPKELTSGFKLVDITFDSVYIYGYRLTILDFQLASSDRLYIGSGTEKDGLNTLAIRNVTFTSNSTTDGLIYVQDVEDGPIVDVLNLAGRNTYDLQNYETAIMDFYTVDDTIGGRGFLIDYEADINKCLYTGADIYCMNGGTCSRTGFNTASCACTPAWTGSRCETDVNECDTTSPEHNCDANANCAKLDGGFTCTCKTGFTGNGTHCEDINECPDGVNTHLCALTGTCANKPGGYDCTCNIGYENGAYGPCSNINECRRNTDNCDTNADCADTVGSFTCACKTFYTGNGTTCVDIDECAMGTHACGDTGTCVNKVGGYNCSCNSGYEGGIGGPCTDIKECNSPTTNACSAQADCTDTIGSYVCACKTGYTGDGKTCNDINECTSNTHICHDKADCANNNVSFTCTCKTGYTGTGTICTDINECVIDTDNCHNDAKCTNNDGSFTCACETGFTGDGFNCADNDECTLKTDNCHSNATCGNTFGSFTCTCKTGYTGNGIECTDQNECDTSPCDTNAACTNNDGSFACECNSGFTGNGFTCTANFSCNRDQELVTRTVQIGRVQSPCYDGTSINYPKELTSGFKLVDITFDSVYIYGYRLTILDFQLASSDRLYIGSGTEKDGLNTLAIRNVTFTSNSTTDGLIYVQDVEDGPIVDVLNLAGRNTYDLQNYETAIMDFYTVDDTIGGRGFLIDYEADINKCLYTGADIYCMNGGTCSRTGFNTASCACTPAWTGSRCETDVNECDTTSPEHNCDANANCAKLDGGFTCTCKTGFTGNGTHCEDINECPDGVNTHLCALTGTCANKPGGYDCTCNIGYENGTYGPCSNINECSRNTDNCDTNADCADTVGSFTCACKTFYTGNGTTCVDIDECAMGTHACGDTGTCVNKVCGYNCSCNSGYEGGIGGPCTDIKECNSPTTNACSAQADCNDTIGSYVCVCKTGYTGDGRTCNDINECTSYTHMCHDKADCTNNNGSFTCTCKTGYIGTGTTCTDQNECDTSPCDTNAACTNNDGSFACECNSGFTGNGFTCTDDDECTLKTDNCNTRATCTNILGSFRCACKTGFTGDGVTCEGSTLKIDAYGFAYKDAIGNGTIKFFSSEAEALKAIYNLTNEMTIYEISGSGDSDGLNATEVKSSTKACLEKVCGNYADCVPLNSFVFICRCAAGFDSFLSNSTFACKDIKECNSPTTNACSAQADCTDTIGSYVCACKTGYTGDGLVTCNDINECTSYTHICHDKADCTNNNGSFTCTCKTGYIGTGTTCTDINECAIDTDNCHKIAKCTNNDGSFTCACETGFTGDGFNCADNDECILKTDNCHSNATCGNTFGSFTCTCKTGYTGNGIECTDQNECVTSPCDTNAACTNNDGSFACECNSGFTGNGFTCTDDDECTLKTDNCNTSATCTNILGSFRCACKTGFTGDGVTCEVEDVISCCFNLVTCQVGSTLKVDAYGFAYKDATGNDTIKYFSSEAEALKAIHNMTNEMRNYEISGSGDSDEPNATEVKNSTEACLEKVCGNDADCVPLNSSVFICRCATGFDSVLSNSTFACKENECLRRTHNCSINSVCNNTDGGYECSCNDGFIGDGYNCIDVDECMSADKKCHSNAPCFNTPGSYECKCKSGYTGNGINCNLINACEKLGNCDFCWKNAGGVECICNEGYSGSVEYGGNDQYFTQHHYGYNNITCSRFLYNCSFENDRCQCSQTLREINTYCFKVDQCTSGQHDCDENATCIDSANGTYTCQCKEGFTGNGFNCTDINECSSEFLPCSNCSNTVGGYSCGCEKGFDGENCTDIDECQTGRHICHPRAKCTNTYGSYNCTCDADYYEEGDDGTWCSGCPGNSWTKWIDADIGYEYRDNNKIYSYAMGRGDFELLSLIKDQLHSTNICANPTNAMAQVTNGKHYLEGEDKVHMSINGIYCLNYEQNDRNCNNYNVKFCCPPENKCLSGTHNCSGNTLCNITDDGYTCLCIDGFTGDGYNCTDVDECMTDNKCHSKAQCINTIGSYECNCKPGYTGNGTNCNDINECEVLENCDGCWNYAGGVMCTCNEGLTGWIEYGGRGQSFIYTVNNYDNVTCPRLLYNCSFVNNRCQCNQTLREINTYCFKVDQCTSGQHDCDENATCIDSANGTYSCQCKEGFTGNGFNCTDINECWNDLPPCSNCSNTVGGYSCGCKKGFDGENCTDIDECRTGKHNCHPRAKCTNTHGGYNCTCAADYYVKGDDGTWCSGCPGDSWTKWIDADVGYRYWYLFYPYAEGRGDFELLSLIKDQLHNTNICANPTNAMAQVENGKHYLEGGDKVHMSIDGIYCLHSEQEDGSCNNYNVKFCCPDNTSVMNSTKSDNTTSVNSTEPTESISWLGSITEGQSEIITTFVCIGSPIDVQWTKSPAGSTFLYKLQNKDRTTNKIKQTSVQMLLPGDQLFKVTRMLSPSPDFCVTSTKISSDKNDITVEQVARIEQNRMNSVSKVIHKLQSKTVRLTFVDFE